MSIELRKYQAQDSIDEDYVMSLARQYGAYDGENVYHYAMNSAEVGQTLTDEQMAELMELRDLDDYPCGENEIYMYSEKIDRPEMEDTDFLFGV